ncbi:zinc finger protein 518A isoform X2 [Electrophorus electricus]|nr:zinc finger protein 518A isoform X2 [Electrophorus electricus]XP_035387578.1 zinc finger protein 518A isoform X2 [Electrophorus electricus]XP_035387579.1 zinc finger protein 518A isoform X2 [Electrophorus electricus]
MEVDHTNKSSHHGDSDQAGDNERGNWHRRLRLRKSSASSVTVKRTIDEEKVDIALSKKPTKNAPQNNHVVDSCSRELTFTCSECNHSTVFSSSDLLNHFRIFHEGKPPLFPCDMCSFTTAELNTLQQHRTKHSNSKLTCEVCNDDTLQTECQLTKHCKTQHNLNGQYHCEKCKFSTTEFKMFMNHPCPHSTLPPTDCTEKSGIRPGNCELNGNLLADPAEESHKEERLKQMASACHRGWRRKNWLKKKEVPAKEHNSNVPHFKLLLPKAETKWPSSGFLPFSGVGLLDENGILLNPARILEESQQFLERTVNSGKTWPIILKGEPEFASLSCTGPYQLQPKSKPYSTELPELQSAGKDKLSGLMERNNISVPPDCTTKVIGFKMVDGKKHLVLKVIPPTKPEISSDTRGEFPGVNPNESYGLESGSQIKRSSDQTSTESGDSSTNNASFNYDDATSVSGQQVKQGQSKKQQEDPINYVPQVDNTGSDGKEACHTCSEISGVCTQLIAPRTEESFNVAVQKNSKKQLTSFDVMSNSNTYHTNGDSIRISVEVSSVRQMDMHTLHSKMQEHNIGCHSSLASSAPFDLGSLEEGLNSHLPTLMSEKDGIPHVGKNNMVKDSWEGSKVTQPPLVHLNEQKENMQSTAFVSFLTNQEKEASPESKMLFSGTIVSPPHKHSTEALFNCPSEDGGLLFQDSIDDYTNNVYPRDASIPLDQTCTTKTVEEHNYLAVLPLGNSCHNSDVNKTLEKHPVTTILNDDPEVTFTGIKAQSVELGGLSTQQVGLKSTEAIPIAVMVAVEEQLSQSNVSSLPMNESVLNRKRRGEPITTDSQEQFCKSRRPLVENSQENGTPAFVPYWEPIPQGLERTLRLFPFCYSQTIKVPRLNQPVVVLNHPDTDIPEVTNIMRVVHRHKGAVEKVMLSQGTLKALSELDCDTFRNKPSMNCHSSHCRRDWPQGTVKERFILNLKLKRLCGNKYKVAASANKTNGFQSSFRCWFCGRLFRNQETWVGHGQRHLTEATRDWNKLFRSERQSNGPIQLYYH